MHLWQNETLILNFLLNYNIKNGKKIDPLKVKAATGINLSGKELQSFKKTVAEINALAEKQVDYAENNL